MNPCTIHPTPGRFRCYKLLLHTYVSQSVSILPIKHRPWCRSSDASIRSEKTTLPPHLHTACTLGSWGKNIRVNKRKNIRYKILLRNPACRTWQWEMYKNPHVLKFELIISWNYFAHYKMWIPPDFCKIRGSQMMTGGLGSDARIARWANEGTVSRSRDHSRPLRGSNEERWCIGVRTNCSHTSLIFWTNQRPVMSWGDHSGPIRGQSLVSRPRPLMVILLTFPCITIIPASVLQYTPIQRLRRQFQTCSCLLNNSIHNF